MDGKKVKKAEALKAYFGSEDHPVTTRELMDFRKAYGQDVYNEFAAFAANELGLELE